MIKIDYLIERQEGDKTEKYRPTVIPTELPNVVYIQGPNSSGKSTLLNMIALAFFGRELTPDELNQDLRERLDNLMDSDHQKIQFKIEVDNDALGTRFVSQKTSLDSAEIILKHFTNSKGFPMSPESFRREYKLIYDIPNSPLERLPLLLNSVRTEQKAVSMEVKRLQDQLRRIIGEIKNSRDPDLIEKLREDRKRIQTEYDKKKKIADEELQRHKKLLEYFWARFYLDHQKEQIEIEDNIDKITKHLGKKKRQQNQEYKSTLLLRNQLEDRIKQAERIVQSIKSILPKLLPKDQIGRYKYWAEADIRNEVFYPKIYSTLRKESKSLGEQLRNIGFSDKQQHQSEIANVNLLKTLITILEDYRNDDITIPVVNLPIREFIESLNVNLDRYGEIITRLENIEQCADSLERLVKVVNESVILAGDLQGKEKHFGPEDNEEISRQQELKELETRIKGIAEKTSEYRTAIIKAGLDPEALSKKYFKLSKDPDNKYYENYTESQLREKVKASESNCDSREDECKKLERRIEDIKQDIHRFEEREPHKYHDKYLAINRILTHVLNLGRSFESFDDTLKKMAGNAVRYTDLSNEEKKYSESVGDYLAKKIGTLRHISRVYKVKNINVISKKIKTDTGKIIHFSDLGTGQGQAAYLDTLLSMSENKKIIALFDEIAMMDETSLKPIKDRLKKLYDEKKLLIAVIVQKGEHVKVEPII